MLYTVFLFVILVISQQQSTAFAWMPSPSNQKLALLGANKRIAPSSITQRPTVFLGAQRGYDRSSGDEDDEDDDREKVRVPRRGRSSRRDRYEDDEDARNKREDDYTASSSSGRSSGNRRFYDDEDEDDEDYWDDDDDDEIDYDSLLSEKEYDLLSNVVIPNPLLDSIDPDGAADRFPELAKDPRFWFDIVLFIAALNFLSELGPRNAGYFPWEDIPWNTM